MSTTRRVFSESFKREAVDRVASSGLSAGAVAREATTTLQVGDLELDLLGRAARRGARRIELLNKEFQLLEYLMRHAGQVVTRTMLLEAAWDFSFNPGTNVIDVHISRLRAKIDREGEGALLHTVRGTGDVTPISHPAITRVLG